MVNGVGEIAAKFKYVKAKVNENKLGQILPYRFFKHELIDKLEIVFLFHLETYNDQEFAEAYAAGFIDVYPF